MTSSHDVVKSVKRFVLFSAFYRRRIINGEPCVRLPLWVQTLLLVLFMAGKVISLALALKKKYIV